MKIKGLLRFFWMVGLLQTGVCQVQAQNEYRFHSVFMYNFTKYIQWPATAQTGDFVIGVMGNSPIISELEKMTANRLVGQQKIVVKKFNKIAEIVNCQMLFIPGADDLDFEAALAKLHGKSILVLTDKDGLGRKGSGINFVLVDGKWKFELNRDAMQNAGLKISQELTRLAILL